MEILEITKEIASEASHVYAHSWKRAYQNIVPQHYLDELSLERWTPLLLDSPYTSFVIKDHEEYVAVSSIAAARDKKMKGWGEIISIYVLPHHFHKGYGKSLFAFAIKQLQDRGFNNIYLWVLEENQQARSFYERNGFTANGDRSIIHIGGKDLAEVRYIYNKK